MNSKLKNRPRVVVKVGTSSLNSLTGPNYHNFETIAAQIVSLKNDGYEVVLVSSGAVGFGRRKLKQSVSTETLARKQALAAVGQPELIRAWQSAFSKLGHSTAQVLVTNQEMTDLVFDAVSTIQATFLELFGLDVIPIVNENDAVAVDEIKVGDNDTLSARLALLIRAESLYILGAEDAVYRDFPEKNDRIESVRFDKLNNVRKFCKHSDDPEGTGGMLTKVDAAAVFLSTTVKETTNNRNVYIASAFDVNSISRAQLGDTGTKFYR